MIIAQQLQSRNRAEYLLYMWQVEDIIRLHHCDIDALTEHYLSQFTTDADTATAMRQWYADLCDMMRTEGKQEHGHLQITLNVIASLEDLHEQLLASSLYPYYRQMYHKVLPYIVELRARNHTAGDKDDSKVNGNEDGKVNGTANIQSAPSELTQLFEFLYGIMLLRLQHKEISAPTQQAAADVTALLGQLSDYWKADKAGELKFED